jgi:mono/diheme cytochrome c family protein
MKKLFLLIPVLVGLLFISCGVPEAVPTPAPTPTPSAIDASALYKANCVPCHGANRQGMPSLGPALIPERLTELSDAVIKETIAGGRADTAMPPFKGTLSPEEIDALLQFIKYTSP